MWATGGEVNKWRGGHMEVGVTELFIFLLNE